jgi:hypothetical protein
LHFLHRAVGNREGIMLGHRGDVHHPSPISSEYAHSHAYTYPCPSKILGLSPSRTRRRKRRHGLPRRWSERGW